MKTKILIFKCKLCDEIFLGKEPKDRKEPVVIEHIGRYGNSVCDTHKCKDKKYGVGKLIGAYYSKYNYFEKEG